MSQSRFSIVLVGVSALLRRPFVSRLRPAGFTARGSGGFRRSGRPSVSEISARRVDLRAHGFRFSARTASGLPLGGLAFGLTASAFRHAPLRGCRSASWPSGSRLPLSACTASGLPSAGWPSGSRLPLFGTHRFGVALGELVLPPSASEIAARRVDLRAHCFRFSACTDSGLPLGELVLPPSASEIALGGLILPPSASEIPLGGWPSGSLLPLFGTHRFGVALVGLVFTPSVSELPLGELAFGLTASAFRPAPLRSGCWASSFFRLPLRRFPSAGWPSDSRLPLFGTHRFGVAAGRIGLRASASEWPRRAGSSAGRVGLRAHCFRFSACTASGLPSAG